MKRGKFVEILNIVNCREEEKPILEPWKIRNCCFLLRFPIFLHFPSQLLLVLSFGNENRINIIFHLNAMKSKWKLQKYAKLMKTRWKNRLKTVCGGERQRKSLTALLHRWARSFFNNFSFSFEFPLEFKSFPLVFPIDEWLLMIFPLFLFVSWFLFCYDFNDFYFEIWGKFKKRVKCDFPRLNRKIYWQND